LDKTITTVLLIIAGIVCSIFLFNSVYPMINRSSAAMVSMSDKIDDRMKTQIDVVHAANSTDRKTIYIWIKNVGSTRIDAVEQSDLFLGPTGDFMRISHESTAGGAYPRWSYDLENGTEWGTGTTIKITVLYDPEGEAPGNGTYFIKMVIPNGIATEYYFSM
jgi:archaellum component FlaF (FlaF/FlaG flagellin family)